MKVCLGQVWRAKRVPRSTVTRIEGHSAFLTPVAGSDYQMALTEDGHCKFLKTQDITEGWVLVEQKEEEPSAFHALAIEIAQTVAQKQLQYGDSFGKAGEVMAILYPHGIPAEQLEESLTVVRILDKLFRIATSNDPTGEDPYRDIAGYSLLAIRRRGKE